MEQQVLDLGMRENKYIVIENLSKSYKSNGEIIRVFENFNCKFEIGKVHCLVGPNGAGKTTLLQIVLRNLLENVLEKRAKEFTKQDAGSLIFPYNTKIRISYLMQDYTASLLPWLDLYENIAVPLLQKGVEKAIALRKVSEFIKEFNIEIPRRKTYEASGGEKQKTCILRAFISEPDILIWDEPFSALDWSTKDYLQQKLIELLERNKKATAIVVSHDPKQAVILGDRILVLSKRPAKIVDDLEIALDRKTRSKMAATEQFLKIESVIRESTEGNR